MEYIEYLFLWFVLYSVAGWVYESALCSASEKRFVNRGFLNGPYCPIYGSGAVLDILVLGDVEDPVVLFFAAALLTGVLEYLTSWGMEKLFHARWWDYSERRFNIKGRVCLRGAIAFSSFSLVLLKVVHPVVAAYTMLLPPTVRSVAALVLFAVMLTDAVFTITKFSEFNDILRGLGDELDGRVQTAKSRLDQAGASWRAHLSRANSQIRRMLRSFPRLRSTKYDQSLDRLRELLSRK